MSVSAMYDVCVVVGVLHIVFSDEQWFQDTPDFICFSRERAAESDENQHFQETASESTSMADLIVKSAVRDELEGMNVAADFPDALDEEVSALLADAARRADDNDRKTVQPRDL
jgi:histone H3/H4